MLIRLAHKIWLLFVTMIFLATTVFAQAAAATTDPVLLGGMDLNSYCAIQTQGGAILSGSTWDCTGNNLPIDLNAACVWQYNISGAYAVQTVPNNPYSYQCYSTVQPSSSPTDLGGINLNGYCVSTNQGSYPFLVVQTWSCSGSGLPIDLNAACVWQYNISGAYAAEAVTGDANTYNCYMLGTPPPPPTTNATDDWATYKFGSSRSNYNNLETIINPSSVSHLKQILNITPVSPAGVISDEPAVINNIVYYGDWTG